MAVAVAAAFGVGVPGSAGEIDGVGAGVHVHGAKISASLADVPGVFGDGLAGWSTGAQQGIRDPCSDVLALD